MAQRHDPKLPRRRFLQGLATAPLVMSFAHAEEQVPAPLQNRRVPVLQGWTDETTSILTVLGKAGWSFKAAVGSKIQVQVLKTQNITNTDQVLYRLQITGLAINAYQQFAIYDAAAKLIETRSLKGVDLQMTSPRLAVASCSNYRKLDVQDALYSRLQEQAPDMLFFIGDIVYSNSRISSVFETPEDPSTALERYVISWNTINLYQLEPLVPTLTVWDDHDYGTNNGGASHPYKDQMHEIFRSFYPLPDLHSRLSFAPGVGFRFRAFGMDTYFLDDRTYYVKNQSQWGDAQDTWFVQDYNSSPLPAWIINGTQFFHYFFTVESVEKCAPPSLRKLQTLLQNKKKPTALFSGDVHCSQIQEIPATVFGFKTYEITSSAIHSSSAGQAMHRKDDINQLFYYGKENFLIVQPTFQSGAMDLEVSCATENGTTPALNRSLHISI